MLLLDVPTIGKAAAALVLAADLGTRFRRSVPRWYVASDAAETAAIVKDLYGDAGFWPTPWLGGLLARHVRGQRDVSDVRGAPPWYTVHDRAWESGVGGAHTARPG